MVFEFTISIILGFSVFLSFTLPILAHEKGTKWWKVRNLYHILIFSTASFAPLFVRTIRLGVISLITSGIFLLWYYWMNGRSAIAEFYDIMRREQVTPSERSIYTVTTNVFLILLLVLNWETPLFFTLGMLVMALGDSMGELVGRTIGEIEYEIASTKTVRGSFAVFSMAFIILGIGLNINGLFGSYPTIYLTLIALIAMLAESISVKFLDNILMPYLTALALKYPIFELLV